MKSLRERLRSGDPARTARPLDAEEMAAIRQAMAAVRPGPRGWRLAAGLALAVTALGTVALLVLWPDPPSAPVPVPMAAPVVVPAPAPSLQVAQAPPVLPRPRGVRLPRRATGTVPPPLAQPAQVKEIRFVTASGTQILWTVRSSEEGA
ncbi:MAG TPA: hypothetical protein VFV75_13090 [Candidatus Polarisedimenticolaceae bacterium]|nr:hypothetical protein [Candidatus Polarisedimenticolaceae bacterium]